MRTRTAAGNGFTLTVGYPENGWFAAPSVVPALRSPHELCVLSNRHLQKAPVTSQQNQPDLGNLDAAGLLIWIYYEVYGDPAINDPTRPPIPDYSHYSYPLVYSEAQVFPRQVDYEWSSDLVWMRLGHNLPPNQQRPERAALTVMIWQGTQASPGDLRATKDIVNSISAV